MKTVSQLMEKRTHQSTKRGNEAKKFEQLGIPQDDLPAYKGAEQFARQFQRCDRQEYAHTKYAVNTCCDE